MLLLKKMREEAVKSIYTQCAREYWKKCAKLRATQLRKLTPNERKSIPTENLSC